MTARGALWRLVASTVVAVVLYVLVTNAIEQPVATQTRAYTAEFTDASGLHLDADVRVRGVRVGKVDSIRLDRRRGQSVATVGFTIDKRYGVVSGSRLAIKFQSLTGLRYLDVRDPAEGPEMADLVTRVPTEMTEPSFDITTLFNGLEPVIATLSPADINTFTTNAIAYLSGDGGGLEPMLESIHTLTKFVSDRQQVISTLMRNLSSVAGSLDGESDKFIQILDWVNRPLDGALNALDEFRKSQLYGLEFTDTVTRLLTNIGFPPIPGAAIHWRLGPEAGPKMLPNDVDLALDRLFSNMDDYVDAFKYVPVFYQNIPEPPEDGAPLPCSHGRFELPVPMDVLLNGQKVLLCNQ